MTTLEKEQVRRIYTQGRDGLLVPLCYNIRQFYQFAGADHLKLKVVADFTRIEEALELAEKPNIIEYHLIMLEED